MLHFSQIPQPNLRNLRVLMPHCRDRQVALGSGFSSGILNVLMSVAMITTGVEVDVNMLRFKRPDCGVDRSKVSVRILTLPTKKVWRARVTNVCDNISYRDLLVFSALSYLFSP